MVNIPSRIYNKDVVVTFDMPHGGAYIACFSEFSREAEYLMYPGTRWVKGEDDIYRSAPNTNYDRELADYAAKARSMESKLMKHSRHHGYDYRNRYEYIDYAKYITPENMVKRDHVGRTPLHFAAFKNRDYIYNYYLDNDLSLTIEDDVGWTPLYNICLNSVEEDTLRRILEKYDIEDHVLSSERGNGTTYLRCG